MTAAVQTIWAELIAATLGDAGVTTCVISPGSRSTPLVAALGGDPRLELITIIDERAAAFYALGAARATGLPAAIVCTSGTAAAHYLPAIVEASLAGVPMIAVTADRPPELHDCGASQTIDQIKLYGGFVRGAFDLGAPEPSALALRAVRRKLVQAVTLARGPHPGPVHVQAPLRKPLEPAPPASDHEHALAAIAAGLRGDAIIAPPRLAAEPAGLARLAAAIAAEPHGVIIAGAMPAEFSTACADVLALAARSGYPVVAEAGSQLRRASRDPAGDAVVVGRFDLVPPSELPRPRLAIELGAEPVAAGISAWLASAGAERWVLAGHRWHDADASARGVILGDVADAIARLAGTAEVRGRAWSQTWRDVDARATAAAEQALTAHPGSEAAAIRAALGAARGAIIQVGNSLPIRVLEHVCADHLGGPVLTQRGAAGIDGLIASAAGATRARQPVLLVLGDVSFAHDLGALIAARTAVSPLAILVIDNRGGQIFAGLPIARAVGAAALERHWLTAPGIDPVAIAAALEIRAVRAPSPAAVAAAVTAALAVRGPTVIHAPVTLSGAHDVRRTAIELYARRQP